MKVGAKLANFGPDAFEIAKAAARLEAAGADSLWLSDRIFTPRSTDSRYPFTASGSMPWGPETPFIDIVVAMAVAATHTRTAEIGAGVLVLPLRTPVVLAKQLAAIDALSGGRVVLGIGVGWLADEYEVLGIPFEERGSRTDEAVEVLRACWEGEPKPFDGRHYRLPPGMATHPTPARRIPVLVGGMSPAALRRAGRLDGWFGYLHVDELKISEVRAALAIAGTPARSVLRLLGPARAIADAIPDLVRAGVTEVVIDLDWRQPDEARQTIALIREQT